MIAAIVLAAGQSVRMGTQKMLLPWGGTTVLGKVIQTLVEAEITDIHLVTGGAHGEVAQLPEAGKVRLVFNKDYANGEMLTSIQVGLGDMGKEVEAVLVVLGDQPQIETKVVRMIVEEYQRSREAIIVPSYKMHRGHPWLLGREYWAEVLSLKPPETLHDFLVWRSDRISYVDVDSASVLQDLDTRQDYSKYKP